MKTDYIAAEARVIKADRGSLFIVELDNGHTLQAHFTGRLRNHHIRVMMDDWVRVEISPYDMEKCRIVYRHYAKP